MTRFNRLLHHAVVAAAQQSRTIHAQLFGVMIAVFYCASFGTPSDDLRDLLDKGDGAQAKGIAAGAHANSPGDPQTTLLWARTLDNTDTALAIYKRIARDKTAPDSIRSQAYFLLGCAAYVRGIAHKATGYFSSANDLSGNNAYTPQLYAAAANDTADTAVVKVLAEAARDSTSHRGIVAGYYLALYRYGKKDYASALSLLTTSSSQSDTTWFACPANALAYSCAVALSRPQEASAILTHIRRAWVEYLERPMLAKEKQKLAATPAAQHDSVAWLPADSLNAKSKTPASPAQAGRFSLQVGAFGTMQNAHSLKVKLASQFQAVSVAEGTTGGKPVFRVHVGAFATKESAQAYGDSTLAKKGISFRVVEE